MIRPLTKLACLALASGALFSPDSSSITTEVAARRVRMKKLGKMQMQKKGDGAAAAGAACLPCLGAVGMLTGVVFLLMWQISTLWGPITSTWETFYDPPTAPLAAFPDYKLLPYVCQDFQNLDLFGPLPSGIQLWQHAMKWMLFCFQPGLIILQFAVKCFGGSPTNPNRLGPLLMLTWLGFFNFLWFTNVLELDAVNKNEPKCTQWHTTPVPNGTVVPEIPVIDTHMRDLSMFLAIGQGLTILPLSWFNIKEQLNAFINPEAAAQAEGGKTMNALANVFSKAEATV